MIVLIPSRGRPQNIRELVRQSFSDRGAELVVAIDEDDQFADEYTLDAVNANGFYELRCSPRERLGPTLNALSMRASAETDIVGFMGDDHRPRTEDWARRIEESLRDMGTGIVYGNDLIHGENLPTAVFMTSDIIRTLGYMAAPGLIHLYIDNFWKELGRAAGCLKYLPEVIIEHLHPIAGKTEWDETYKEANDGGLESHDEAVFLEWFARQRPIDASKIRAIHKGDS